MTLILLILMKRKPCIHFLKYTALSNWWIKGFNESEAERLENSESLEEKRLKISMYEKTNKDGKGLRLNAGDSAHYTKLRLEVIDMEIASFKSPLSPSK